MKIEWNNCFRLGATVVAVYLIIHYWSTLSGLAGVAIGAALPLILGVVIAYILNILMSMYERHLPFHSAGPRMQALKRPLCMVLAIVSILLVLALLMGMILPELAACIKLLLDQLPTALESLSSWLIVTFNRDILAELGLTDLNAIDWQGIVSTTVSWLTSGLGSTVGSLVGAVSSTFSTIVTVVMSIVFALYLLAGKEKLAHQISTLTLTYLGERFHKKALYVLHTANSTFRKFIVGQCMEAVVLGVLCILGMALLRFPYATMIGTLVGFTALIPVAGAYIGAVVGAFMILTVSPIKALLFVVFLVVLQQLEGNLIYPKIVGSSIGLPGLWVMAAVTIGGGVAGVGGMLIGVPLAATIYQLIRKDVQKRNTVQTPAQKEDV